MSGEGAKVVKEPPRWMVMWPFESAATKLPTYPNLSGVYIMFEAPPTRTSWCTKTQGK